MRPYPSGGAGDRPAPHPAVALLRQLADYIERRDFDAARGVMRDLRGVGVPLLFLKDLATPTRGRARQ